MNHTNRILLFYPVSEKINFKYISPAIGLAPKVGAGYFLLLGTHGFLWVELQVVLLPLNLLTR